jgi:hypothetical protein
MDSDTRDSCEKFRQKLLASHLDTNKVQLSVLDSLMLQACESVKDKPYAKSLKPVAEMRAYDPELARETNARLASEDAWVRALQSGSSFPEAHIESAYIYYLEKYKK